MWAVGVGVGVLLTILWLNRHTLCSKVFNNFKIALLSVTFAHEIYIYIYNLILTDTGEDSILVHRRKRPKVDTLFFSFFF